MSRYSGVPSRAVSVEDLVASVDAASHRLRLFQDRHALRAEQPWTAVMFRHRYTTLSHVVTALGPDHSDVREVRTREIAVSC